MYLGAGTGIDVKLNTEVGKRFFYNIVIFVNNILRRAPLLPGLNGNGNSMLIGAAYKESLPATHSEVPDINICRDIDPGKVTDMGPLA